jgi:PAS domain S-box-containing protein
MLRASQALSSEIVLKTLIETLMRIAIEYAGAERGVLVLLRANEPHIAAEAVAQSGAIEMVENARPVSSSDVPVGMIHYAIRRGKSIILDSAVDDTLFAEDEYVKSRKPQSVLCIPILKQAIVVGVLYLENSLARRAFTLTQSHVLEFLASQAAISLENAYLYADLQRSEAFLAEGQRMSQAGSWVWDVRTGKLTWSDEQYRIFGYERDTSPVPDLELFYERVVEEDRDIMQRNLAAATRDRSDFSFEFRISLPDGTLKYLLGVGRPLPGPQGEVHEYIGTTIDVTKRKLSEDALRAAQEDFARAARLATMGELTALIAHEVSQPLSAIVTDAGACLSWLARETPNLQEAREAAEEIVKNGHRAADTITSIRAMARKAEPEWTKLQIDKLIEETLVLLRSEIRRRDITLETDLLGAQQHIFGDPIKLQQVLVNLVMNSIDAMADVKDRSKILRISVSIASDDSVLFAVGDTGIGIAPSKVDEIFEPLFTTKSDGMGMGLSISKSIVEMHGGRLWASPGETHGSIFRFTLPTGQG